MLILGGALDGMWDDEHELSRTNSMDTTDIEKFNLGLANSRETTMGNVIAKRMAPSMSMMSMLLSSHQSLIEILMMLVQHLFAKKEKKSNA